MPQFGFPCIGQTCSHNPADCMTLPRCWKKYKEEVSPAIRDRCRNKCDPKSALGSNRYDALDNAVLAYLKDRSFKNRERIWDAGVFFAVIIDFRFPGVELCIRNCNESHQMGFASKLSRTIFCPDCFEQCKCNPGLTET